MLTNINRIFLNVLGIILLLFMLYVVSLNFDLYPQQIEYNETKEFLSNLSYEKDSFPSTCLVNVNNAGYCGFSNQLILPNYIDIKSFNCYMYVNDTLIPPNAPLGVSAYNSTHISFGCIYRLQNFPINCSTFNSYTFIFEFNATPLPRLQDVNITILNNLSYYDGTAYQTCNVVYNYTFMPAPLTSLTHTYIPLNGTRTYKNNVIYAYPNDYFLIILNASNIKDNKHTGRIKVDIKIFI